MHSTATPLVERILVLGKGNSASLPYLFIILISLSAISAFERSIEFTAAVAEQVTKNHWHLLTSVDASEFLTSSIKVMTISAWQWLSSGSHLFVCLFVCWNKTRKTILRLQWWEGGIPPGSDHNGRGTRKSSCSWFMQTSWAKKRKKLTKIWRKKITQLVSRHLNPKPVFRTKWRETSWVIFFRG